MKLFRRKNIPQKFFIINLYFLLLAFVACSPQKEKVQGSTKASFGDVEGNPVEEYTLTNRSGIEMKVITYGGIVTSLKVPDKNGKMEDVVLGYNDLSSYVDHNPYFGAIIGRYGNRIAKGKFSIDSIEYSLAKNNGENSLHGGVKGFDKVIWRAEQITSNDRVGLELSYLSKDGEEGYPGNLDVKIVYWLTDQNTFEIEYSATTDKPTAVNLTHHSYFNLQGESSGSILKHELMINAEFYTPVDSGLIPTGELAQVKETPFDFNNPTAIGARIESNHEQLGIGKGYDHNFILNSTQLGDTVLAASVYDNTSGRYMEIFTTEPAIQFYSGNFLDGSTIGKSGTAYRFRNGFCLETQHSPDSPNRPEWPTTLLKPGEIYSSKTIHKFSIK